MEEHDNSLVDRDILPRTIKPVHYELTLTSISFEDWTYKGQANISGLLNHNIREIVLHSLELKLHRATLTVQPNQVFSATNISYDLKKQRATLAFDGINDLAVVPTSAVLSIEFEGIINHDLAGFYRSQYKPAVPAAASVGRDADFHYMTSTQFEACDARRAFPCFDEPNLKAHFTLVLEIPDDQVALSNMPVASTEPAGPGKKRVAFERTLLMSTYLLAWAIGDFEFVEASTDRLYDGARLPMRVYTTRGLKEQAQWALQHAPKIIDFFSDQFGVDYPLPKCDILAVHEFTHGAMENWGLVTYRMTAILFDEELSEARFRNRIAYVVAHELAHQWFGNLVTMNWWDELWLNEGFATWAGWLATDHLHPDWEVWPQFICNGMNVAFDLDAVRASHPIHVPVRDALEANQVFDKISYMKGCSIIRMLASHLGVPTFLQGISVYLKRHAYQNATTTDLWNALQEASGIDVHALMEPWIEQVGFPVITIAEEPGQISIRQSRFLSTGDVKPEDDGTTWWVPLSFRGKMGQQEDATPLALTAKEDTIRDVDDLYTVNTRATGFYRVNYPPLRLNKLAGQLNQLTVEDKIYIASSAADLAFAGNATTAAALSFVQGLKDETHYRVLAQALDVVGTVKWIFGHDEQVKKGLERFTLRLIEAAMKEVGWEAVLGESYSAPLLRKRLILTSVANNDVRVMEEANRRFASFLRDPEANALPADLRLPIYRSAIKFKARETAEALKDMWFTTKAIDGKELCLQALGKVTDEPVLHDLVLPFLFNISPPAPPADAVPAFDMHCLASSLAHNRIGRDLLWQRMKNDWKGVTDKLGGNPIMLDRMVNVSLQQFSDRQTLAEIDEFFKHMDTSGFDRTLDTVKDRIRAQVAYQERDLAGVRAWLDAGGWMKE